MLQQDKQEEAPMQVPNNRKSASYLQQRSLKVKTLAGGCFSSSALLLRMDSYH